MNYKSQVKFLFKNKPEHIAMRLENWAKKYNFELIENNNNTWIYKRGSHFRASCSFDVRYVPTIVRVEFSEINTEINCLFHVKSFFYHAMPTDNSRVDEQLELLVAYLKGVFEEKLSL